MKNNIPYNKQEPLTPTHCRATTTQKVIGGMALSLAVVASSASAADYSWSPGDIYQAGGSGTWSTSTVNWSSDGSTFTEWASSTSNNAYFQGAAGTYAIDVDGDFSAGALYFETDGYLLSASSATTMNLGGGIIVADSVTATVGDNLTLFRNNGSFGINGDNVGSTATLVVSAGSALAATGNGGSGRGSAYFLKGINVIVDGGSITMGNGSSGMRLGDTSDAAGLTNTMTIKNGGTVTVAGTYGVNARGGNKNTSSTVINLDGGTLATTKIGRSNTQFSLNFNGGTLQALADSTDFINDTDNAGGTTAYVKEGGAIFDSNGFDITVAQDMIHGGAAEIDGGLTKTGVGTLTLNDTNTYNGDTSVEQGTLLIGDLGSITSNVNVASGAAFGGDGTVTGDVVFEAGSLFAFSLTDTLTVTGTVSFEGFGVEDIEGLDSLTIVGTYNLIAGDVDSTNLSNIGSSEAYDLGEGKSAYFEIGSLNLVVVPEPSAFALIMGGFALLMIGRRRSK